MSDYLVEIDVEYTAESVDITSLTTAAAVTLAAENVPPPVEMAIRLTDNETVQELNRDYRGIDKPTDVLSFGIEDDGFVLPPDTPRNLGDIVIAIPYTKESALKQGHSLARELLVLTVHGTLHLLGYDDEDDDANEIMLARQDAILATLP